MGHHEGSSLPHPRHRHNHHALHVHKHAERTSALNGRLGTLDSVPHHGRGSMREPIRRSLHEVDGQGSVQAKDDFIVSWLSNSKAQAGVFGQSLQAEQSDVFRNGPKNRIPAGRYCRQPDGSELDDRHQARRPPEARLDAPGPKNKRRVNNSSDDLPLPTDRGQRAPQYEKRSRHRTRTDRYDHGHGSPSRRRASPDGAGGKEETKHTRRKKKTLESSKDIANNFSSEVILNGRVSTCPSIRPGIVLNGHASTVWPLADLSFRTEKPRLYVPLQETSTLSHSRQGQKHSERRELEETSAFFARKTTRDQHGLLEDRPERKRRKRKRVDSHDSLDTHARERRRRQISRPLRHRERHGLPEEPSVSSKVGGSSEARGQRESSKPTTYMTWSHGQESPEVMSPAVQIDSRSQASTTPVSVRKLLAETGVFKGVERLSSQDRLQTRSNTVEDSRDDAVKQAPMEAKKQKQNHLRGGETSEDTQAMAKDNKETGLPSQGPATPHLKPQSSGAEGVGSGISKEAHASLSDSAQETVLPPLEIQESGIRPPEHKTSLLPQAREEIVQSAYLGSVPAPLEPPVRPKAPKLSIISHLEAMAASPRLDSCCNLPRPRSPKLGVLSHLEATVASPHQDTEFKRRVSFECDKPDKSILSRDVHEWSGSAIFPAAGSCQVSNTSENLAALSEGSLWMPAHNLAMDEMPPHDQLGTRQPRLHFSQVPGEFSHDADTVHGAFSKQVAAEDMGEYIRRIENETCEARPYSPVWQRRLHNEHYADYPLNDDWSNAEEQFGISTSTRYSYDLNAGVPPFTQVSGPIDMDGPTEPQERFETSCSRQPNGQGVGRDDHGLSMIGFWRPNQYLMR